ncbi:putative atp synthase [Dipodascopsis tothii]|uniref:putative atp synthase n=1 Tax=Dipodascopsis tothii TaxID=44089 RepID=UPI0034CF2D01
MLARTALRRSAVAARGFSTAAVRRADATTPPVQLFGVDGTYASALYTASAKSSAQDATAKSLTSIKNLLAKDSKLGEILADPALSASDKTIIVETIISAVGTSDASVKNLLTVLAENNRLSMLPGIIEKYGTLMSAFKGEIEATVTSATKLDSKTLSRIEAALAKSSVVGQGKKLKVTNKINPDILGGLVVEVGDRTVDLSVSAKIGRLNALIAEAI